MTAADETPAQPTTCPNVTCGATRTEYDRDPCTRQRCPIRAAIVGPLPHIESITCMCSGCVDPGEVFDDAQPDVAPAPPTTGSGWVGRSCDGCGQRVAARSATMRVLCHTCHPGDLPMSEAEAADWPASRTPDVAPAPDGNAGGADVYREAAKAMFELADGDNDDLFEWQNCPACPNGVRCACSGIPYPSAPVRAAIDAGRAPLLAEVERLRARIHEAVDETQRRYAAYQARCNRFDAIVKWAREQLGVEVGNPRFWNSINSATQHALLALTEERDDARADLAEATRERAEARAKAVDGTPLGYVVFMREHGHWSENWDGEVHVTRDEGLVASADARAAGYEAVLTAAIAVEPVTDDGGAG